MADDRFLHLQSSPLFCLPPPVSGSTSNQTHDGAEGSVVVVRDVSQTILEQQKRAAIHQAGQTLADLTPTELADMTVQERIELLKSNIIYYSKDLLKFDVLEIRLLDKQTSRLEPLLAEEGIERVEAENLTKSELTYLRNQFHNISYLFNGHKINLNLGSE